MRFLPDSARQDFQQLNNKTSAVKFFSCKIDPAFLKKDDK